MDYICYDYDQTKEPKQPWIGRLNLYGVSGAAYEVEIMGRGSSFHAIVGRHRYGNYICIPDHEVGSELSRLTDVFWNWERLSKQMNEVDAATVAHALNQLADL